LASRDVRTAQGLEGRVAMKRRGRTAKASRRTAPTARARTAGGENERRLLTESRRKLKKAQEQQTATAEVLKVISRSSGDLKPVFEALLENATRICEAAFGAMLIRDGDGLRRVALHNAPPAFAQFIERHPTLKRGAVRSIDRLVDTRQIVRILDMAIEGPDEPIARLAGARSLLVVPLLKHDELLGLIGIYRQEVRPFTDKQIKLVESFAAQAVIAIENARLLNELRQRTGELTEALEQQTATSEVLGVISSSPGELQIVFRTMLERATHLCNAELGTLELCKEGGFALAALHGAPPAYSEYRRQHPIIHPAPASALGRIADSKSVIHVTDMAELPEHAHGHLARLANARTLLAVPLLKDGDLLGAMGIYRQEPHPFTDKQIELVQSFAAQAVIAIENARLLNELRQRTGDLSEALKRQTATSEVLSVISRSPDDLESVFDAMLANASRICEAKFSSLYLFEGGRFRVGAIHNAPPAFAEFRRRAPVFLPPPGTGLAQIVETKRTVHVPDIRQEKGYLERNATVVATVELGGFRTTLGVPMVKDDRLLGCINIYRQEVRPFTDKQIELVESFAAQAVIAIENARLLSELRESLQQQTATADVLKVISRSTFDLQAVLDTLVESAARLCEADMASINREKDAAYQQVASYGYSPEFRAYMRDHLIPAGRGSAVGRAVMQGRVVHIPDVLADPEFKFQEAAKLGGIRTILGVPLLRDGISIGVITLQRKTVRPFADKQIELVESFADQAAIAIENVRLFEAEQQRTRELAQSLQELQSAQDRLVQTQKLASLGQLTAGIAHEIKNPLNFVNNFSAVSGELIDELQEALQGVELTGKARAEIDELVGTLGGNLDRIVQHGRRADSIVRNMLLHSREGSGEHRLVDINALVEESLNLAYHGARAERQGFNITLERSLDPAAGEVDLFPQEITRVLLNLISNGFYAATRRKEAEGGDYEPILRAATRSLGDRVEIAIRDNGTGIAPEARDRMFTPFFTTKPAGEGTGLGLSISHDIVVKQHAGAIEVDSRPGEFTELRIILPRPAASLAKAGGRS
jgi:GAF domain-containing protein